MHDDLHTIKALLVGFEALRDQYLSHLRDSLGVRLCSREGLSLAKSLSTSLGDQAALKSLDPEQLAMVQQMAVIGLSEVLKSVVTRIEESGESPGR